MDAEYVENNMDSFFRTIDRKYTGPVFDAHTHLGKVEDVATMVKYEEEFNVKKIFGIVRDKESRDEIEKVFPDLFVYSIFLSIREALQDDIKGSMDHLETAYADGFNIGKLWFSPRWVNYFSREDMNVEFRTQDVHLNDPKLEPLFQRLDDLKFTLLLHVSDPDLLYEKNYQPTSKYGVKKDHINALKNILEWYPNITIVGAHMASQPEDLKQLDSWLDKYPNLYVDTGSAKWMVREFGSKIDETLEFFDKHQDRIMFGTDFVAGRGDREPIPGYYINRFLSFEALFETDVRDLPFPIPDPENDNKTKINGLDLPQNILKKLYWENANKIYNK
ncbi:MAG: amidohydrolase family protein [Candidatus Heimdallarchaeaceae archaeon]